MTCSRPCTCASSSSSSCSCSQPGTTATEVRHYRGDYACPDCLGINFDPESRLCLTCDPILYRVVGYPDEWFLDTKVSAAVRVSAKRELANAVAELMAETGRPVEVSLA